MELFLEKFMKSGSITEVILFLKNCQNKEEMYQIGMSIGNYFLTLFPNNSEIISELALMAYSLKDYELSLDLIFKLESFIKLSLDIPKNNLLKNTKKECISKIKNRYIEDNWTFSFKEKELKLITFSITTCKRYDLFERTMNSFLNCEQDLSLIDRWICVDDNSSEEDRIKMKKNFPFFEFFFKSEKDKGHCRSMNIIQKEAKTPFLFHMEDDWQFFHKDNYILRCLEVLSSSENIAQCLINKNYSETERDNIVGGIKALTQQGNVFFIHEHCKTEEEKNNFNKEHANEEGNNCNYWPHYSLRPSLLKTIIFEIVGSFNENANFFEREFADRYFEKKYMSTFLPGISCLHIGRLTSERFDKTKLNAYDLNNESQFTKKEKTVSTLKLFEKKFKTFVINLKNRPDRFEKIKDNEIIKKLNFQRFEAIDGSLLKPNEKLQRIFEFNDYNMRQGMVGCALSHIKLYIQLLKSNEDFYIIFEDDIEFTNNFLEKFDKVLESLPSNWDLCYLSYHLWKKFRNDEFLSRNQPVNIEKWNLRQSFNISMGGTTAYMISKKGAIQLLNYINSVSMTNGIDTMQQKTANFFNVFYCKPQLVFSECSDPERKVDTDIQYNFNSLSISSSERFENELKYFEKLGRIVDVLNVEETKKAILNSSYSNIIMCSEYNQDFLKCIFPSYRLVNLFIAIPNATKEILKDKCFERLKRNDVYDIDDAIIFS